MNDLIGAVLDAPKASALAHYGKEMFRFKTELGFPPDMFLAQLRKKLNLTRAEMTTIVNEYLYENTQHIKKAGITDERLEKLKARNHTILNQFIKTGEMER